MRSQLTEKIESFVLPIIGELSAELVELNMKQQGETVVVDIIADKPSGGITIDECTFINKQVVWALEKQHWFGEDFVVEVSSPGLNRALKTPKDFLRAAGRKVRIHLMEPVDGKLEHHGKVAQVIKDQVLIQTKNKTITIPLDMVAKAVQVIE